MDFNLSRLSTRSFEQLIQSLSIRKMGSGVVIFGDGPDGGREAVFEGTVSFPSTTDPWSGYGVIQAKFKQRPEGTTKDTAWALKELEGELKKFIDEKRNLRKPEYYIFATNITLSSVAEKGGKDKAAEIINKFKTSLGLKDFRIWDYDQLRTLIEENEDVRTTYAAWITSGDILSKLMKLLDFDRKDFKKIMRNFIQKELLAEQFVKLGQAGHNEQDHIPLAQVFVDLPVSSDHGYTSTAMKKLLLSSDQLHKSSESSRTKANSTKRKNNSNRIVFVGGPGQGKSTLTQFFCQAHRVAFLDLEQSSLPQKIQSICRNIKQECGTENLRLPTMPRFPIRVELNQFATTLAKGKTDSLFSYILQRIEKRTSYNLGSEDLRKWLESYPWLVALDGLDEVPSSSNRNEVLDAVQDFLIDANDCNADLLIITTTRPQGYNDDFSPTEYQHFQLEQLNKDQALHYSSRLITQKWVEDEDKIQKLLERMKRASTENSTARLMRSPLQVTIMALLVESLGEPPKERWRLFDKYYQVINEREKEREIPAASLLNSYEADIDTIHQQVGLKLQTASERSGGTEALLTISDFDNIVKLRLNEEGHTGKEALTLKANIVSAAIERLVFLVAPKQDYIGFEIRSLQEYMAAECLMRTTDDQKIKNLRAIVFASHWRNVFLFAAGKCFHKERHLRPDIVQLCNELNEGDLTNNSKTGNLEKTTLAGSILALEILEDGAIQNQPSYMKIFLRLALKLLELPPSDLVFRIAEIYDDKYQEVFKEEIQKQLSRSSKETRISAWQLLIQLKANECTWAAVLTINSWPDDAGQAVEIIKNFLDATDAKITAWLSDSWSNAILRLPVPISGVFKPFDRRVSLDKGILQKAPETLTSIYQQTNLNTNQGHKVQDIPNCFTISTDGVSRNSIKNISSTSFPDGTNPSWLWLAQALSFWEQPTANNLYKLVERFSELHKEKQTLNIFSWPLPWPVKSCVHSIANGIDRKKLLDAIARGDLGHTKDWQSANKRWGSNDLSYADYLYCPTQDLPFDREIGKVGYPANIASTSIFHTPELHEVATKLHELWGKSLNTSAEKFIRGNLIFVLGGASRTQTGSLSTAIINDLPAILNSKPYKDWIRLDILNGIPRSYSDGAVIDEILSSIDNFKTIYHQDTDSDAGELIEMKLLKSPNQAHLLNLLTVCSVNGYKINSPSLLALLDKFQPSNFVLLQLAYVSDTEETTIDIGSELLKLYSLDSDEELIENIIKTVKNHKLNGVRIENILCMVYEGIPHENWRERRSILETINEQHQKYLSNFEEFQ